MPELHALPALADNYIWMLAGRGACVVVDPGEPGPVRRAAAEGLRPGAILLTHHHPDHVGGAEALSREFGAPVYAPADPRITVADHRVGDGDRIEPGDLGLAFEVLAVPGHTLSHAAFHGEGVLFAGDTLFSLGCGRLFEGSPAQMLASLTRLAALPGDTLLCCGHEYTAANGRFAQAVDPGNAALAGRVRDVAARRAAGQPSLPVPLASERDCNPFLRSAEPAVREALVREDGRPVAGDVDAFARLRAWKDRYAG